MARIAILPLPEPGHINATIALGRELAADGHGVRFCGAAEDEPLFAPHRVAFSPLVRELGPSGPEYRWDGAPDELALVDSVLFRAAIDAELAGKRVVSISTTFSLGYDPDVPPVTCGLAPPTDPAGRARVQAAWEAELCAHAAVVERHPHNGRRDSTLAILYRFAASRGWPRERLDERAAVNPVAVLPELVLAPAQLDFARRPVASRRHAGPCVHLDRREPDFDFTRLAPGRPVVYASFGSQSHRYPMAALLEIVAGAARALGGVEFVVATGSAPIADPPDNLHAVARAPQLGVLRRAQLMISHGGLNGIKEALLLGVPLLVLPVAWDQPGNAARVAFHGLGRAASWDGMTSEALAALVREVLGDAETGRRVARLGEALRAEQSRPAAAGALTQLVRDAGLGGLDAGGGPPAGMPRRRIA